MSDDIRTEDYSRLAQIRRELRLFLHFSESAAGDVGLTGPQYQALLALRAAPDRSLRVGQLAEQLLLKPHSATGLVDRLALLGHVERIASNDDKRRVSVRLTDRAEKVLASLAQAHRAELRRMRPMLTDLLARL